MAKNKKVVDPDEEITGKMFERAKELGYNVNHPTMANYRAVTKRLIEKEKKNKKNDKK